MTETQVRVKLSELAVARVRCINCGTVIEVPIEMLGRTFHDGGCRHCDTLFVPGRQQGTMKPFSSYTQQ